MCTGEEEGVVGKEAGIKEGGRSKMMNATEFGRR